MGISQTSIMMRLENWEENGNKMLIVFRLSENYVTFA